MTKSFIFEELILKFTIMEKRFKYLLGLAKHTENYLMYNELKELKKDVLKFPMLRIDAMQKRIEELEFEKEFLIAKLEVNGQN